MSWHRCSICRGHYKGDRTEHRCDIVGFFIGVNNAGKRWAHGIAVGRTRGKGARFVNLCRRLTEEYDANDLGLRCAFIIGGTLADIRQLVWRDEHEDQRHHYFAATRALGLDPSGHKLRATPPQDSDE